MDTALKDGEVLMATDLGGYGTPVLFIGTRSWTYAEQFVWDCAVETFGEEFLRKIGAWQPKHEEVMAGLRKGNDGLNTKGSHPLY